jgi:hypothetical protein
MMAALVAAGQERPAKPAIETPHLMITTSASHAAGRKVSLYVDVAPKPAMHVYSPGQDGYISITLTLDADASIAPAKPRYPPGEKLFMPLLNETQLVYSKPFRITQDATFTPAARVGTHTVKGTLRYQACDDKICYLPKNVPVEWTVER